MSDQTITSLIEKLEQAEVGSRELDALVHVAVANDPNTYVVEPSAENIFSHKPGWYRTGNDLSCLADPVTTSLDAALALAERVGIRPYQADASIKGKWSWMVVDEARLGDLEANPYARATAATPALALCAAILRAQSEARV